MYLNLPNLPEFTWICLNLPEFIWIYLNSPEFTWIHLNLPEFAWIYRNLPEFTRIYRNIPEWVHLGLLGFTWVHFVSLGFTWVILPMAYLWGFHKENLDKFLISRDPIDSKNKEWNVHKVLFKRSIHLLWTAMFLSFPYECLSSVQCLTWDSGDFILFWSSTMYSDYCTVYSSHCTMYFIQCTVDCRL